MYADIISMDLSTYSQEYQDIFNHRLAQGDDLYGWKILVDVRGKKYHFVIDMNGIGGRGLRYADNDPLPIGSCVALALGTVVESTKAPKGDAFKWQMSKSKYLVIHEPTWNHLGNLINTSDGTVPNNCRLCHKPGNSYLSVISTRVLYPGDELLVPYGGQFTKRIRKFILNES